MRENDRREELIPVFGDRGFVPKNCESGHDFELLIIKLLTFCHIDAKLTGGNDNGVDIIAQKEMHGTVHKFYIQCKFYNRPVGKTPVQEVYTGTHYFGNDGHPVVITTNKMTYDAKAYAKKLGVETITNIELNELSLTLELRKRFGCKYTGLFGLIMGYIYSDAAYMYRAVENYKTENKELSNIEKVEEDLVSTFDKADALLQESADYQMRATACQREAISLQKAALLKNLRCP